MYRGINYFISHISSQYSSLNSHCTSNNKVRNRLCA